MSQDILRIIKRYRYIYISILMLGFFITYYAYLNKPLEYRAIGNFKYIGPSGTIKITKVDNNGTVTYESFKPGDGGLHIPNLIESKSLNIEFNSGNNLYVVQSRSLDAGEPLREVNEFLDSLYPINTKFLTEKLMNADSLEEELKLKKLIENPHRSFPVIIKAKRVEVIDNRQIIIFFGIILSFFTALTGVILKERMDGV